MTNWVTTYQAEKDFSPSFIPLEKHAPTCGAGSRLIIGGALCPASWCRVLGEETDPLLYLARRNPRVPNERSLEKHLANSLVHSKCSINCSCDCFIDLLKFQESLKEPIPGEGVQNKRDTSPVKDSIVVGWEMSPQSSCVEGLVPKTQCLEVGLLGSP
jgi:hypothetical protein